MPDDDGWLVVEIMGHCFVGKSIEFNIRWTAGDHTWEPYAHVKDLEALDHYYALMGVTRWQSLAKKAMIAGVDGSSHKRLTEGEGRVDTYSRGRHHETLRNNALHSR
jgi:hypothetical protein